MQYVRVHSHILRSGLREHGDTSVVLWSCDVEYSLVFHFVHCAFGHIVECCTVCGFDSLLPHALLRMASDTGQ